MVTLIKWSSFRKIVHKFVAKKFFEIDPTACSALTELNETAQLKNANNFLNSNIYSYLETSGDQISNLYLNVVHFLNTRVN
jgi:hypothetical protein